MTPLQRVQQLVLQRSAPLTSVELKGLVDSAREQGVLTHAGRSALETVLHAYGASAFEPSARSALKSFLDDPARPQVVPSTWTGVRPPSSMVSLRANGSVVSPQKRSVSFIFDAGDHAALTNVRMNGSFDKATGAHRTDWGAQTIPMRSLGNGRFEATIELLDDGTGKTFEWGVIADGPLGKDLWAVMGEDNLTLKLDGNTTSATYAPTTYHKLGAHRHDDGDVSFGFWAPNARDVKVRLTDSDGNVTRHSMVKDEAGNWSVRVDDGWKSAVGCAYVYEVTRSDGAVADKRDPYARVMQGEQRGLSRLYLDRKTGIETTPFGKDKVEFMRFEIGNEPSYTSATLVLKDRNGKPLDRTSLLRLIGDFDPTMDPKLKNRLRGGTFDDLWSNNVDANGAINLQNEGGTWTTLVNNPEKLVGLRYELQVWSKDPATGKLVLHDDKDGDGIFSAAERRASPNNDAWSDVIEKDSGLSFRGSVVADTSFAWQHDAAPRERDPKKWVMYQLHVGSFLGMAMNSQRSSFDDIRKKLEYLKKLGITTIELNPTNEFEGNRDWGYMGTSSLATESSYGFEDASGKWVTGYHALKQLIDEAHRVGLNVVNDVVYNHIGGNDNHLWETNGKENPYFNWSEDPTKLQRKDTDWGAMPAYRNPRIKQLFVDHAVMQIEELHFDGLRFDFTEPMKATWGGCRSRPEHGDVASSIG